MNYPNLLQNSYKSFIGGNQSQQNADNSMRPSFSNFKPMGIEAAQKILWNNKARQSGYVDAEEMFGDARQQRLEEIKNRINPYELQAKESGYSNANEMYRDIQKQRSEEIKNRINPYELQAKQIGYSSADEMYKGIKDKRIKEDWQKDKEFRVRNSLALSGLAKGWRQ